MELDERVAMLDRPIIHQNQIILSSPSPYSIQYTQQQPQPQQHQPTDSGIHTSNSISSWPPTTPSSTYNDFNPCQQHYLMQNHNNNISAGCHTLHHQAEAPSPNEMTFQYAHIQPPPIPQHLDHHTQHHHHSTIECPIDMDPPQIIRAHPPNDHQSTNNHNNTNCVNMQPCQLPVFVNGQSLVQELEDIMKMHLQNTKEDLKIVTNSVCLLFRFSIDEARGYEVCVQGLCSSKSIMELLYLIIQTDKFDTYEGRMIMLCFATGSLTSLSKYEEGREALLGYDRGSQFDSITAMNSSGIAESTKCEKRNLGGVEALLTALQSNDTNVVIFAITAIHLLLLDRRHTIQEIAKEQIKPGIKHIVGLLDNQSLVHKYEFKVIVLDCLQILAYGNDENRILIKNSRGPSLILKTIQDNFDNPQTEGLIETASRVLKSLSSCQKTKLDIIDSDGIIILANCIDRSNLEILKTCLWTLRNLSDVISLNEAKYPNCVVQLVDKILNILEEFAEEPSVIICALGILANLTYNNERIKQFICNQGGIKLILRTIQLALREAKDMGNVDEHILEPAIYALCNLMNQSESPIHAETARQKIISYIALFEPIEDTSRTISDELSKAMRKLRDLAFETR